MLVVSAEPVDVGPIDNLSVPSAVTKGYAPNGKNLIYVSVRSDWEGDDDQLTSAVRSQAEAWFGPDVKLWNHLATVKVAKLCQMKHHCQDDKGHVQVVFPLGFFYAVII